MVWGVFLYRLCISFCFSSCLRRCQVILRPVIVLAHDSVTQIVYFLSYIYLMIFLFSFTQRPQRSQKEHADLSVEEKHDIIFLQLLIISVFTKFFCFYVHFIHNKLVCILLIFIAFFSSNFAVLHLD